jgi:predicted nuclease of predicted toxin-antitoxin system
VRVLLDANLPRGLARLLAGHEVRSAHAHGWSDLDDGPLLDAAAAAGYDAFVTMDQGLPFQQNLAARPMAVVLLRARTNRPPDLAPLVPAVLEAPAAAPPGMVAIVPGA